MAAAFRWIIAAATATAIALAGVPATAAVDDPVAFAKGVVHVVEQRPPQAAKAEESKLTLSSVLRVVVLEPQDLAGRCLRNQPGHTLGRGRDGRLGLLGAAALRS